MAGFPDQLSSFVGQDAMMSRAAQALAPRSGRSGIVFEGVAGTGKTVLALELCYTQRRNFRVLIWHAVPCDPVIGTALRSLCTTMDEKIQGLGLSSKLEDQRAFGAFMPMLTELVEHKRILIVIDSAEQLLGSRGTWRDSRMRLLVNALTSHKGLGRLIVTTRRPISGISALAVLNEHVQSLSAAESFLLARDLPRLLEHAGRRCAAAQPAAG